MSVVAMPPVQQAWGEPSVSGSVKEVPGGYLASGLKKIHNDTSYMFPPSSHSTDKGGYNKRWRSLCHSDYVEQDFRSVFIRGKKPKTSLPIYDPDVEPPKQFMSWKVPSRITESADSRQSRHSSRGRKQASKSAPFRQVPSAAPPSRLNSALPHIDRLQIDRPAPGEMAALFPVTPEPASYSKLALPPSARRSARDLPRDTLKEKQVLKKQLMRSYDSHDIPKKEGHWLSGRSGQAVEQSLRIAERAGKPAEVSAAVNDWLTSATERDRQVAINFFQSISESNLISDDDKANEILDTLKSSRAESKRVQRSNLDPEEESRLRYIRLLTPTTRANRWQHQTWHHLPPQQNNNPVNKSAIMTNPQSIKPRQFSIHPDWG